ncbi:MAG: M56 family metallopeptidase [Prosthecobacter sp.]|uniref:M56 family metallopeptidase n=1 Tax=Prosthecobacter sp. TaxID=1965333 RepID=UPI003BB15EB7
MTACWIAIALKATLWAALMSTAALVVPVQHPQARRRFALLGMWGLWVLPWLPLPWQGLPTASIDVGTDSIAQVGWWWQILTAVWAIGSLVLLLRVVNDVAGILRMVRQAEKSTLNHGGAVEVRFTAEIEGPCMTGWLRPCVLLPLSAASWPEGTLRATLRHECQHARQMDGLHRFCAALVRACFWWNPAMHVLCGIYEAESEVCCDEAAATACSRREYGEMLLAHATLMPMPAFAVSFARRSGLRVRIQRLFATRRDSRWLLSARWLTALALIISAAVLMASIRVMPPELVQGISLKQEAKLRLNADPFPGAP